MKNTAPARRIFRDFYGCTAAIVTARNGSVRLTASDPYGSRFWNRTYASYRSARSALGQLSEGWREVTV